MWLLRLGVIVVLCIMIFQDFKFRGITWWLFPLLLAMLLALSGLEGSFSETIYKFMMNGLFVGLQIGLLILYFSVRRRTFTNIFQGYLGLGDLLFLVCLAAYLPLMSFAVFYVGSLLMVIVISLCVMHLLKISTNKIPLAGYQALFFLVLILIELLHKQVIFSQEISILHTILS